jgi:hypothetical protein
VKWFFKWMLLFSGMMMLLAGVADVSAFLTVNFTTLVMLIVGLVIFIIGWKIDCKNDKNN